MQQLLALQQYLQRQRQEQPQEPQEETQREPEEEPLDDQPTQGLNPEGGDVSDEAAEEDVEFTKAAGPASPMLLPASPLPPAPNSGDPGGVAARAGSRG